MREVTVYYAWDDSEFYDRDECLRYERQAIEAMIQLVNELYGKSLKRKDLHALAPPRTP